MFEEKKLWKERFSQRTRELGKYLPYMFNGFVLIIVMLGVTAYYIRDLLQTLNLSFPLVIICVLGFLLSLSPVYNFLKEPDKVFLLPLENRLRNYIIRCAVISLVFQGHLLLLLLAVFMPLLEKTSHITFEQFLPIFLVLLCLKSWNMALQWKIGFFTEVSSQLFDKVIRFCINTVFLLLYLSGGNPLLLIALLVVMCIYFAYFDNLTKRKGLKWDDLIENEENRMMQFYRIANLFIDVPQLKNTVKRRKWLDFLLRKITFRNPPLLG
jgi:ABC-2 type transport system permease protein